MTPKPVGLPLIVAHRGSPVTHPENTLVSFQAGLDTGALAAECDVHCTLDGEVIVLHDDNLQRVASDSRKVADMTLAEVRKVDVGSWKGARFAGEKIPTLREVLELLRGKQRLNIEIKAQGIAHRVVETVRVAKASECVNLISFSHDTLRRVRQLAPDLPTGLISSGVQEDTPEECHKLLRSAFELGVQFLSVHWKGLPDSLIHEATLSGLTLWSWTLNDPESVRREAARGAASVTSDDPAMALKAIADR
ncbi:hypothetical protein LLH03_16940 [bacterium]|nr:hypothetical protein [bacterium]